MPQTDFEHYNLESSLGYVVAWRIDAKRSRRVSGTWVSWIMSHVWYHILMYDIIWYHICTFDITYYINIWFYIFQNTQFRFETWQGHPHCHIDFCITGKLYQQQVSHDGMCEPDTFSISDIWMRTQRSVVMRMGTQPAPKPLIPRRV